MPFRDWRVATNINLDGALSGVWRCVTIPLGGDVGGAAGVLRFEATFSIPLVTLSGDVLHLAWCYKATRPSGVAFYLAGHYLATMPLALEGERDYIHTCQDYNFAE